MQSGGTLVSSVSDDDYLKASRAGVGKRYEVPEVWESRVEVSTLFWFLGFSAMYHLGSSLI